MVMDGALIFVHLSAHCLRKTKAALKYSNPEMQFIKDYG